MVNKVSQSILENVKKAVDSQVNCDRTFRAKVTGIVQTDKIRVLHNGKTYTVYSSIFCEVDDMVRVCVPCGNWQELYVIENRSKGKTLRDLYQKVGELEKRTSGLITTGASEAYLKMTTTNNPCTVPIILAHDFKTYGQHVVMRSGGNMIIGGGESPEAFYDSNIDGTQEDKENLYLTADSEIYLYTRADSVSNRKKYSFTNTGDFVSANDVLTSSGVSLNHIASRSVRQHLGDCNRSNVITVDGDLNTYYPVAILLEKDRTANDWPVMFCLGKTLGTKTAAYPGNHSNGTSSCAYGWTLRQNGWDGNCNWMKTLYAKYNYASLVSHMQCDMSSYPGFCLFLRGGGTEYRLMCSTTFSTRICYSETNLGSSTYPQIVTPRTDMGNRGIVDNSIS